MRTMTSQVPRPAFHFTPQRNWMNDPNGLVFHDGLWHLYFQYNPEGADWGNMSWGHATSADLQHWTEHPVALRHRDGEQIFSGSAVSTSGPDGDRLTAFYTSAYDDGRQAQSSASSVDGGYTWASDAGNPILDRGSRSFRDPKVIRFDDDDGGLRWIMLAVEADERQVLFYSSRDLGSWEYLSAFGPLGDEHVVWECPDLVPLAVDGDPRDIRWVLTLSTNPVGDDPDADGSSMSYIVGQFDGVSFVPEAEQLTRLDQGRDFYAGITFHGAPGGAAVMLGWMGNWRYAGEFPSAPWRGAMSLPRWLGLRSIHGAVRLVQEPPSFVRDCLARSTPIQIRDASAPRAFTPGTHSLIELRWDPASTGGLRLRLQGDADGRIDLEHAPETNMLRITRTGSAMQAVHPDFPSTTILDLAVDLAVEGGAQLLLSLDGPLLEVFVGDGEATASNLVVLGDGPVTATLATERHGPVVLSAVDMLEPARRIALEPDPALRVDLPG